MWIEAHDFALHSGFNLLKHDLFAAESKPSELPLSHPSYHNIVLYGGNAWGRGRLLTIYRAARARMNFLISLRRSENQHHAQEGSWTNSSCDRPS
jgi:hypothetical protein